MNEIPVRFVFLDDTTVNVNVSADLTIQHALEELVRVGAVKAPDEDTEWRVTLGQDGPAAEISGSMTENGVKDGATLFVEFREAKPDRTRFFICLASRVGKKQVSVTGQMTVKAAVNAWEDEWWRWYHDSMGKPPLLVYKMDGEQVNLLESIDANGITAGTMLRVTMPGETVAVKLQLPNGYMERAMFPEEMAIKDVLEELVNVKQLEPLGKDHTWHVVNEGWKNIDVSKNAIKNGILFGDTLRVEPYAEIGVVFVLHDSRVECRVPVDMFVEDALEQFVECKMLPPLTSHLQWFVCHDTERKNVTIPVDYTKTFAENHIADGTRLIVTQTGLGDPFMTLAPENAAVQNNLPGKELLVNFILMNGNKVKVAVPEDMIVKDALEQLVEEGLLDASGCDEWFARFEENGQLLDNSKSFAENGVTKGTSLRVTM